MGNLVQMKTKITQHELKGAFVCTSLREVSDIMCDYYCDLAEMKHQVATTLVCDLLFIDTRVKMLLVKYFKAISKLESRNYTPSSQIIWRYDFNDEDIEEFGEILEELTGLSFVFVEVDRSDEHFLAAV